MSTVGGLPYTAWYPKFPQFPQVSPVTPSFLKSEMTTTFGANLHVVVNDLVNLGLRVKASEASLS